MTQTKIPVRKAITDRHEAREIFNRHSGELLEVSKVIPESNRFFLKTGKDGFDFSHTSFKAEIVESWVSMHGNPVFVIKLWEK